ncbi:MAG: bifunctional DNA-formamidopyrimidine glycosylase/DNA-(apurinic or apyrimidinic site) lyase [Patescibacteria group bacterium]|jgi:formamidopyrimidine-DNA glycosylase
MPELPEVETIVRELDSKIKNKKIKSVEVKVPKMVNFSVKNFKKYLIGSKIKRVYRRAKMIIIELDDNHYLLIHLKMTGQLIYAKKDGRVAAVGGHPQRGGLDGLPNKFTHIVITFFDGSRLFYNDMRKFGWMKIVDGKHLSLIDKSYGIEPFKRDFTLSNFLAVLAHYSNRKIKQILMDQSLVGGVGNIYADESCFCAKIRPTRIAKTLTKIESKNLFLCISKIMKLAISKGGTSADTYVRTDGTKGGFEKYLKVYGRGGQKCKRCSGVIKKIKLNGRGTHYCESCQK